MLASCSEIPDDHVSLTAIEAYPLRVRRPTSPPADPKAGPGGLDYQANPLPTKTLDCVEPESLFEKMNLEAITGCLAGLTNTNVYYSLDRNAQPVFRLDKNDDTPACLVATLSELPVPRELFFRAKNKKGDLTCYNSRVSIEAGEVLGIPLPIDKVKLKVIFPLPFIPKKKEDTLRILSAWILTPFFNEEQKIDGKYVPRSLCNECFNLGNVLEEDRSTRRSKTSWPKK